MKKVLFQQNIWNEGAYNRLIDSLVVYCDFEYKEVNVIPFTDTFDREINFIPDYIFGSGRFVNICRKKEYPTFPSYAPIESFYLSDLWVNGDGETLTWGEFKRTQKHFCFVKPYTEKFFTATFVENHEDIDKIQLATSFIENEDDELVRVSSPVNIKEEIRFFVIGEKIITGSHYKIKGRAKQAKVNQSHAAWISLQEILNKYGVIDDGFVIDLGLVDNSWKIVELNNLNSAGLYECDTDAIARALKYLS